MNNKTMHTAIAALFSCSSSLAVMAAMPAYAQDGDAADDTIIVTGSRIKTNNVTSAASPVLSIGGDEIATSGETDITFLLRETPALQGSLPANFSAFNGADTDDSDLGIGFLNLRSLGIERTLVLQNGRRHVAGTAGQAAVDVNTIPVSMLDRVEVLTGGASSIYGADAVTGVVNFILRDGSDFDGLEIRAQGGISDEGDAEEAFLSVATGFEFANGRGSAVVGVEYTRNEAVFADERSFAGSGLFRFVPNDDNVAAFVGADPGASNTFAPNATLPVSSRFGIISILNRNDGLNDAFAGFALGLLNDDGSVPNTPLNSGADSSVPMFQVFDNGTLRPFNSGTIFTDLFDAIGGDSIATDPDIELVLPESDRILLNANADYEINKHMNFFLETKFAFTDSIDSAQVNGFNDDIPISLENPFIPAALRAQINSLIGLGVDPILAVSRDSLDINAINRQNSERTTFRIVGGLQGELPHGIEYELSYNYGRTDVDVINPRTRIEDRFFAAVDSVIDPATGEVVCRSDLDSNTLPGTSPFPQSRTGFLTFEPGDGQCVPVNIFGENTVSREAADFIWIPTKERTTVTQEVFLATLSGDSSDFFELPAGPIGFAAGFEYRNERSQFTPDGLDTAGLTFGATASGPTFRSGGTEEVYEGFIEGQIPIAHDLPLMKYFEITGSARFSDYDSIGSTTAWSVGGRWQPHDWLTFRGTFSNAVRPPNIGELFSPQQPASLGATQDPCNPQFINGGSQFRAANCALFVAPGFDSSNFNTAFVPGLSGGNPDLQEEKAETITAGFVFRPDGPLQGLLVIADFYDIKIDGAIDALGPFDIAQACVDLPSINNQFCDQIFRNPVNGDIDGFVSGQINLGSLETRGVDWSVTYDLDVVDVIGGFVGGGEDLGNLRLGANGTRFLRFNEFQDPTDLTVFEDRLGEFAIPTWIVNFNADWTLDDFNFGWNGRFESSQLLPGVDNGDIRNNPTFVDPLSTGSGFVHDFTADYQLLENINVYGGVNNVLDRDPFKGTLSRPAGPRGRFFFLGARVNL